MSSLHWSVGKEADDAGGSAERGDTSTSHFAPALRFFKEHLLIGNGPIK